MGPILICDKSALQALSRGELNVLRKYYFLNIPPVLLTEILGDLKKHDDNRMSQGEVRHLAEKLVPACSCTNLDFGNIIRAELAGEMVSMDCRPFVGGGKPVKLEDGKRGIVLEKSREASAILRWQRGEFLEAQAR